MLGKKILSHSNIFLTLILFGLILVLVPIKCDYDLCADWRMKGFYMNDTYFEQYGGYRPPHYEHINFLKKHYYHHPYEAWRDSYGNIKEEIDFKRDFHMGFRNYPYSYGGSTKGYNYGIAIVFGPHKANKYRLEYDGIGFLVHDLDKSIVIIFRNDQNIFILNCLEQACDILNPTVTYNFNQLGEDQNIFIHIIYSAAEHSITLYKNDYHYDDNLLLTYDQAYLTNYLERGRGYLGVTATDYYGRYFNYIGNTFYCINGGEKITPIVSLSYETEIIYQNQTLIVPPLKPLILRVEYSTTRESELMGQGTIIVENKEIILKPDDDDTDGVYSFTYYTEENYGTYTLIYKTDYDEFLFYITVQSSKISLLNYTYGEEPNKEPSYVIVGDYRILKYGSLNGDFDFSNFEKNNYLYFYVTPIDDYGYKAEIKDIPKMQNELREDSKYELTLKKVEGIDYIYQIGVPITNKGNYTVSTNYFDKTIYFTVKNLIPNKATCYIENFTKKMVYDREKEIKFICEFKDGNDDINIQEAIDYKNLIIETNLYRNDEFLQKINGFCSGNKCVYNYITDYSGTYKFETKYGITEMKIINSNENIFYVSPEPKSLDGCYFYVYDLDLWVNIEKIGNTIFNYYEDNENSDNFLLIDFVDIDKKTKYSELEQPYKFFDLNKINGMISDEHSGYKKELAFEIITFDNKQYILVKLIDSKNEMKRSSLEYKIILNYGITQNLRGQYFLDDLNGYEACRQNLEINNSIIKITNENSIKAGSLIKMAELILRTDNTHIHNYFLDEDEYNINFTIENNNCKEENNCLVNIEKSSIDGIYNLKFRSNKTGTFKIIGIINNNNLKNDNDYFTVKVEPISEAHYLEKIEPIETDYIVGDEIKFGFNIYDNYNNSINYDLTEGNLGLEYYLYIDDKRTYSNIKLEKINNNYYIKETNTQSGVYKIILKTSHSDSKIEFIYTKHPGKADLSLSSLKLITSNKLNLNEESKAEIKLVDKYKNDINSDSYSFDREIKNVIIYASNGDDEITYEQDKNNKNLFISEPINLKGRYHLIGLIDGEKIDTCYSCIFEVVDYGYDFSSSQLKMIGEKIIIMEKDNNYNLYAGLQRPAFEFDFMIEQGLPSNEIENDTIIYANITDSNNNEDTLKKIWIDKNKILWIINDKYELNEGEKYTLKIGNNNTEYNYYLSIVNYGDDKSENNYDILKTFVSPNILYLKAGISDTFVVEFRDNNNLRYNKPLLKEKLLFTNNSNLEINSKLGNKNGQIIVEVKSDKVCEYLEKCIIKMKYDDKEINTEVQIIVSAGDLDHFIIDEYSFDDKDNKILISGKAGISTKINLIPYDFYGNIIKDSIFNKKIYSEESLGYLFNLKHESGYKITLKSSINPVLYFVELSILSEKSGNLYLSSIYLDENYTMIIEAGAPSKYSVGYLEDNNGSTTAGSISTFIIEPKDENGNKINDKDIIEKIKNNYNVKIYDLDGNLIVNGIEPKYNEDKKVIEYIIENTEAKTKIVEAYYNDEEIILNNNIINVVSGDLYLNNTKLKYDGQKYNIFETLKLSLNTLPIIDLELYDEYENKIYITNLNNNVELKLIDGENELSDNIIFNQDLRLYIKKISDYYKISKIDNNCKLKLIIDSKIEKEINIDFIGEPQEENKEEKPSTFIMDTDDLILKAGEQGLINLSFYTEKGKPMGYFFDHIEEIDLSCTNEKELNTLILPGKFFGTYNIIISSIFATEAPITCTVIAIEKSQQFNLNIIPNKVNKCQKIPDSVPNAKSGELFNLNLECFDLYGNKAILEDGKFGALIKNENNETFDYNINLNEDNSFSLYFIPTKSGKYLIDSIYLDNPITFETLPGKISPENSYLEIKGNAKAGDEINIDINVFDLYGNKVDLNEDDNLIFDLYYRYMEDSKYSQFEKIEDLPQILEPNTIRFNKKVTKGGFNEFRGIHKNTSTIIKCSNCQIKINSSEFDLDNSDVYKFDSLSKSYVVLHKYDDVLYNYEEDLFIKIYPKDEFGNKVSTENLNIRVEIDGNNLNLNNSNEEFLEFHENNGIFANLNGQKELIIYNGDKNITYFVNVNGQKDFEIDEVIPENTKLLESNLEFTVGKYGYFNFELRNSKNARYNKPFNGEIDIIPGDKNVKFDIYNRQSSTILVLITSINSNIFPNNRDQSLNVKINSKNVFNLKLIIHPGDLSSAEIKNDTLIEGNKLNPIKADKELIFSLIGYDSYWNKVLINPDDAKLIVKNKYNNEVSYKSSYTDLSNGEQKYEYELTLVGNYEISSGSNDKEDLFKGTIYTIEVEPGETCPEKTLAKIEKSPITAGETTSIIITPKDKYNNDVILSDDEFLTQFYAYIISDKYEKIDLEYNIGKSYKFSKKLDIIGKYQFNINYNGRKIKCDKLIVNPSGCEPNNTLIYSRDKNGQYIIYDKDTNAYSSINSPLNLHLIFRDEYSNIINDINGIELEEYYLYGNNMEKLYWTYNNGELYLDLSNSNTKKILEHLVTRTNENAYIFTFTVKSKNNKNNKFNIRVNHFGKKEDEDKYGNGDYVLDKCEVSTEEAEFKAGTTFIVNLTLKTQDNLIYNGEFNPSYINCSKLTKEDKSFKCTVFKQDTGIYGLQYYSTLYKERKDEIYNIIELFNSKHDDSTTFEVLLINTFGLPSKEKTEIIKGLEEEIKDGEEAKIIFKLYDEFGNILEANEIINNLSFENYDSPISYNIDYDSSNKEFIATLYIPSTQKYISIQLYYKIDNDNKIELFKETQKSKFVYDIDYKKTVINSRNVKEMKAGDYLDLNIITYDKNSQCYIDKDVSSSFSATVQGPLGKSTEKKDFNFKRTIGTTCQYIYKIDINDSNYYTMTGNYLIVVKANEEEIASYEQTVISGDIDKDHFVIYYMNMDDKPYNDQNIPVGELIYFMVQAYDIFDNKVDHGALSSESFTIDVSPNEGNNIIKQNGGNGALSCIFNNTKTGTFTFYYKYKGDDINPKTENGPHIINYVSGECNEEYPQVNYPDENDIDVSTVYKYTIKCLDKYGNEVTKGGAKFTSNIFLYIEESENKINIDSKIDDKGNGTYEISFVPPLLGGYSIYTYLDGNKYDELQFNLTGRICDKNYTCPNNKDCVDDLRECIPIENRCNKTDEKEEKPFRCNNSDICVDSMTKCDYEESDNWVKCSYMNTSIPKDKQYLCPYYLPLDCKRKYPSYRIICADGICRTKKALQPSQRVCPIGKVLCADLTCKDSVDQCYNDYPECGSTQIRCPDQTCVDDQKNCPTTITCSDPKNFVCPDGTCVVNEIYCSRLKTCPEETPYLCTDNSCVPCSKNLAC